MSSEETMLKRELGLGYATFFGVGLILGAGIYVLIGRTANFSGDAIWASVLFGAVIALATAFSFAELTSMYPRASSTHLFVKSALPKRDDIAFITAWLLYFSGVCGGATAAIGFSRYLIALIKWELAWVPIVTIILLILLSFINWWGIKESALVTLIFTFIEMSGLVFIILLALFLPQRSPNFFAVNPSLDPFLGVLLGAAVFYFAYTGFELQPTLSEETIDARRTVPKAIILAIIICSVLYLLVSLAVVVLLDWRALAASPAPLADAAYHAWKPAYFLLMFIALFSTFNTALGFLVTSSRLVYGLAEEKAIHPGLMQVHPTRRTPHVAVFLTGLLAIVVIVLTEVLPMMTGISVQIGAIKYELIDLVGKTASLAVILTFIMVNISAIILRYTRPDDERPFRMPLSIGKFPLLPAIATAMCFFFIITSFLEWIIWLTTILVIAIGLILYRAR